MTVLKMVRHGTDCEVRSERSCIPVKWRVKAPLSLRRVTLIASGCAGLNALLQTHLRVRLYYGYRFWRVLNPTFILKPTGHIFIKNYGLIGRVRSLRMRLVTSGSWASWFRRMLAILNHRLRYIIFLEALGLLFYRCQQRQFLRIL